MGVFDDFSGSFTAKVTDSSLLKQFKPDSIVVNLDHSDEIRERFRGFKRVVLLMEGERHEFKAADFLDAMERLVSPKTAKRVTTTNPDTDGATGRCHCGACNWIIDPYDRFCRRCGARLED